MNQVSADTHYNYVKVVKDISEKRYFLTSPVFNKKINMTMTMTMTTTKKKKTSNKK